MCNFSSAQHKNRNVDGKLSTSRVRMWNFTRIRRKAKKLWFSIVPVQRLSEQPGLGPPSNKCELQLFFARIRQAVRRFKAFDLGRLNMQFQQDCPKDKKITALWIFFVLYREMNGGFAKSFYLTTCKLQADWTFWRAWLTGCSSRYTTVHANLDIAGAITGKSYAMCNLIIQMP